MKIQHFLADIADTCVMGFLPIQRLVDDGFSVEIWLTYPKYSETLGRYAVTVALVIDGKTKLRGTEYHDELHTALALACKACAEDTYR